MGADAVLHEGKEFENIDYAEKQLRDREFFKCTFRHCNFYKSDLKTNDFEDCTFIDCNLTMADLTDVGLRDITFIGCKIVGVDFTRCSKYVFSFKKFERSFLDYSTFYGRNLKKTPFAECSLKEVEFSRTDLSQCVFHGCDFSAANFENTNLEKADLRGAINFHIDPDNNNVKKAKVSVWQLEGFLLKHNLNICQEVDTDV